MDGTTQDPALEARVGRLEIGMLARVRGDVQTQVEGLRGEVRTGLADKPGYGAMWTVVAIAAGDAYLPLLAHSLHTVS